VAPMQQISVSLNHSKQKVNNNLVHIWDSVYFAHNMSVADRSLHDR